MSEKNIYTNAEDITHWAMQEERHPRPSLDVHKWGIQVGQWRVKPAAMHTTATHLLRTFA
jgi:hypothetical protein